MDARAAVELIDQFHHFDGADLEWEVLFGNFGGLRLRAVRDGRLLGRLQFVYHYYIDCATRMTSVRLRLASTEECERVREGQRCSSLYAPERTLVAIDAAEETFYIWSVYMFILGPEEPYPDYPSGSDWSLLWPEPPPF